MQLSIPVRMTLIICGTILALGVVVVSWQSGSQIDAGEIIGAVLGGLGALLAGLGLAGGPSPRGGASMAALLAVGLVASGCSRPWVGAHRGTVIAHATVNAASDSLESVRPSIVRRSRAELVEEYRLELEAYSGCLALDEEGCVDPGAVDIWLERWDERVSALHLAEDAIRTADDLVIALSEEVVRWSEARGQEPPEQVIAACGSLASQLRLVLSALARFDVGYPEQLDQVALALAPACGWAVDLFREEAPSES